MSVPFSNTKLRVPRGFQNLLEGLAKEVLRAQPEDIYAFGAVYFENLLVMREQGGVDPALEGAQLEDRFYNNQSFKKPDVDASDPQQQEAATRIQTKYRQYHAKKEVQNKREDNAAVKIQAGFRGMHDRHRVKEIRITHSNDDIPVEDRQDSPVDIDLNDPETEKAAVMIQAGFKGFKARQQVKSMKETSVPDEEEVDLDLSDPEVAAAAAKIQAGFRGHMARKDAAVCKEQKQHVDSIPMPEDHNDDIPEDQTETQEELEIDQKQKGNHEEDEEYRAASAFQRSLRDIADKLSDTGDDHDLIGDDSLGQDETPQVTKEEQAPTEEATNEEPSTEGAAAEPEAAAAESDINLEDPEVEKAATTIQAGFKGMKARQEVKALKEGQAAVDDDMQKAVPEEEAHQQEINSDESEKELAATKIQSGFRGMKARREIQELKEFQEEGTKPSEEQETVTDQKEDTQKQPMEEQEHQKPVTEDSTAQPEQAQEDNVLIDTEDPDVQAAATKIQAGFRGYQTRKEMKEKTNEQTETQEEDAASDH